MLYTGSASGIFEAIDSIWISRVCASHIEHFLDIRRFVDGAAQTRFPLRVIFVVDTFSISASLLGPLLDRPIKHDIVSGDDCRLSSIDVGPIAKQVATTLIARERIVLPPKKSQFLRGSGHPSNA